jgi:DNA-binding NarL/FixJ family response regulator
MSEDIRVVLIDDHPLFREGVAHTLNSDPDISVVGEGENAEDAVHLATDLLPDIILLDISMPGGGVHAARQISAACPVVKIAMLTVSEHDDDVLGSLHSGACGYILKGISGVELVRIVKDIQDGNPYVSPSLFARLLSEVKEGGGAEKHASATGLNTLTSREEQILELIATGLSNKEIGSELGIAEKTVKHYVTNVLQKLQVRNRVEAALIAQKAMSDTSS